MAVLAAAFAAAAVMLAPATAGAHALLERTAPLRGAALTAAPERVTLRFSETVGAGLGSVRVFDGRGREVQAGGAFHPGGRGDELAVRLRGRLPAGGYTAVYRVISADSHPVSGGFSFTVGRGGAGAQGVDRLLRDSGAGPVTSTAMGVARAVQYAAIALLLGALALAATAWRRVGRGLPAVASAAFAGGTALLLRAAAAAGIASGLAGLVLEGAIGDGTSAWSAADADTVGAVLATRFGLAWGVGVLAWLAIAALAGRAARAAAGGPSDAPRLAAPDVASRADRRGPADAPRPATADVASPAAPAADAASPTGPSEAPRPAAPDVASRADRRGPSDAPRPAGADVASPADRTTTTADVASPTDRAAIALAAIATGWLVLLPALGGHAASTSPLWLNLPANVAHVLAAGTWMGGIAALLVALRAGTGALAPDERGPVVTAVAARFSTVAGGAVALLLLTGVVQSLANLDALGQLASTAYGRAVLVKAGLLALLLGAGAVQRRRVLPGLRAAGSRAGAAGVRLRTVLRVELLLGAGALAVTGALATYPPGDVQAAGPVSRSATIGPARLELTVDPATTGTNEVHLYLLDRRTGAQWDAPKEVTATASLPGKAVDALPVDLRKAGPGHYVAPAAVLPSPGRWRLRVTARTTDVDQVETTTTVPVR